MITRIEALGYRCLRHISRPMHRFHVLVGPNASGKTTFLDVVAFFHSMISNGLESAVQERTQNFSDLTWAREGNCFQLALELSIPVELRESLHDSKLDTLRYEVEIELDRDVEAVGFKAETLLLKTAPGPPSHVRRLFPESMIPPATLLAGTKSLGTRTVINKTPGGNDNFYSETYGRKGKGWVPAFRLGPKRSALANLPEDESRFPVATWLKSFLTTGIQTLVLNSLLIRRASPPGQGRTLRPDGSNLPWAIAELESRAPARKEQWIAHLQTALPDLEGIRTILRQDDRHRYLMLRYRGGLEVPSWMASDGTLRLLALTLPAYLQDFDGIYLIEEPENGIHPRAVETMFQSLSSVYDAQILLATHSPVVLGIVNLDELMCFAKNDEGASDIVLGSEHPALREWRGETNLSTLFAAGVLG